MDFEIENIETPAYIYDLGLLRQTLETLKSANTEDYNLHYALKANTDDKVLEIIRSYGHGADCVSGGEILKALDSGFPPSQITFAGVGKTDKEMLIGIDSDIRYFTVESLEEIEVLDSLARSRSKVVNICIRINPNIDAHTHAHISTGLEDAKFGIALESINTAIELISNSDNLALIGIHAHIGSQIDDMAVFENLAKVIQQIVEEIEKNGHSISIINVGGGLAIDYQNPKENNIPDFQDYFRSLSKIIKPRDNQKIHFELGRAIVGQCGILATRVLFSKIAAQRNVVIVDAGMTELMRPALYDAYHYIENVSSTLPVEKCTVVGPICESTDSFGDDRLLSKTKRGDILFIHSTGAYGQTMSSEYNHRKKAKVYYK